MLGIIQAQWGCKTGETKEIIMKTAFNKSVTRKLTGLSIVGVVLAGSLLISGIVDLAPGSSVMTKIFFFFLGAIIMVQVVPCLVLFGAMFKAVAGLFGKKSKTEEQVK
jgi:hypothetical protein